MTPVSGIFDHVSIGVSDFKKSLSFYDAVMPALGYGRLFGDEDDFFMAYGVEDGFFIICRPLDESKEPLPCNGSHYCFRAAGKEKVDSFYKAGIENGARDAGPPGIREHYAPDYYAAFLLDPDGHKIEAVCKV